MGTGAISVTNFDRTLNAEVVGDASAYLGLIATSEYASQSGQKLVLEFGSNSEGGQGLNPDSDTEFRNVFRVKNQGTNALRVQFYDGADGSFGGDLTGTPLAIGVSDNELSYGGINDLTAVNTSNSPVHWGSGGAPAVAGAQDIEPGEDSYVHLGFFLNDATDALDNGANSISGVPDRLEIYAEALPETDPL
jgi:hypothetical protein